jgi:hypothetical protein
MDDKLCFVQFIHPGGEHEPDDCGHKQWNKGNHKRKFLKQGGTYIDKGKIAKGEMVFWGEWEPESVVEREIHHPIPRAPRFIYKPYYFVPTSYDGLQNTDPFIFGQQFLYTWCQQRTKKSPTQLRYLSRGSIILFGSCEDKNAFVLDTVFVVDQCRDHTRANYLSVLADLPQEYKDVTIFPWYRGLPAEDKSCAVGSSQEAWRLYFGATYDEPVHGMYSYFPCRPYDTCSRGFARPKISMPGRITDNLYQGKRYSEQPNLDSMRSLWENVAEQVREQGLALGVYAEMPERRVASK